MIVLTRRGAEKAAAALAAVALSSLAAACSSGQMASTAAPTVTVTRTVIATRTLPAKVVTRTRTVARPVPGPTVTVNGDTAQLQADNTCIAALFQNISFWKANGGIVPNGWWDSRCPPEG